MLNVFVFTKRLILGTAIAAVSGVALLAAAFGSIQIPQVQAWLAAYLENWFHNKTGGNLVISNVYGKIPADMTLTGVSIFPPGDSTALIFAGRLQLQMNPAILWKQLKTIDRIILDQAVVRSIKPEEYEFLKPFFQSGTVAGDKAEDQETAGVDVSEFTLTNLSLLLPSNRNRQPEHVEVDTLTGSVSVEQKKVTGIIEKGVFRFPGFWDAPVTMETVLEVASKSVTVSGFSVTTNGLSIAGSGSYSPGRTKNEARATVEISAFMVDSLAVFKAWPAGRPFFPYGSLTGFFRADIDRERIQVSNFSGQHPKIKVQTDAEIILNSKEDHLTASLSNLSIWADAGPFRQKINLPDGVRPLKEAGFNGNVDVSKSKVSVRGDLIVNKKAFPIRTSFNPSQPGEAIYANITFSKLIPGDFLSTHLPDTKLNGWVDLTLAPGAVLKKRSLMYTIQLLPSYINGLEIQSSQFTGFVSADSLNTKLEINGGFGRLATEVNGGMSGKQLKVSSAGSFSGINLNKLVSGDIFHNTLLNGGFSIDLNGENLTDFFGKAIVDFDTSFVNSKIIPFHQVYVDLNSPYSPKRSFRFASSVIDIEVAGSFKNEALIPAIEYWANRVDYQIKKEVLFVEGKEPDAQVIDPVEGDIAITVKNPGLAAEYSPFFRNLTSGGRLNAYVQLSRDLAVVRGSFEDSVLSAKGTTVHNPSVSFSASLHDGIDWKDKAALALDITLDSVHTGALTTGKMHLNLNQFNESAKILMDFKDMAGSGEFVADIDVLMTVEALDFSINKFSGSFRDYSWKAGYQSGLVYSTAHDWRFRNFFFENGEERIVVEGTYSQQKSDSVSVVLQNVNLERISKLIDKPYEISGKLDGFLITRTLSTNPDIRGKIFADGIRINKRIVGDLTMESLFNPEFSQFDTKIHLFSDPAKYAEYLTANDGIGQDVVITGFVKHPATVMRDDDLLYSFQTEVRSFDSWVINPFIAKLFQKLEGYAVGNMTVAGSRKDVQFHGEFDVRNSLIVPLFLNTSWFVTGPVTVDRNEGIRFENIQVRDSYSGFGTLNGYLDWNNFAAEKPLFVEGRMTNLQFLNNYYITDTPFFGSVSGSGGIRLSGTTLAPVLQTVGSCIVTPGAKLTIPLLDVENVEENTNFIEFKETVQSKKAPEADSLSTKQILAVETVRSRTFTELFTMNLQFDIPAPSTMKLLFDPVINEAINAEGGGQMVITLEKEVYKLYGRLDILQGDYLFNGGDLITRRFILQPGGVISWDGDPKNGFLNARAAFRARPDITPVLPNAPVNTDNTRQRIYVPMNLVLQMSGPLYQLQNDFYFELESSVATAQDANIITAMNNLNNPQSKLIQASSLMLTGSFLEDSQTQQQRLGNDFDNKVTQNYFAQLVSNQINNMISRNVSNVDVSINMQGFNQMSQTEVGVAVRLLDDRLVLRREGQISGQTNSVGDIGATYRINEYLSVEAFHKQDPSQNLFQQNVSSGTQQTINGVGLEAQVQFENWNDLRKKTGTAFRKLFRPSGKKKKEPSVAEKHPS